MATKISDKIFLLLDSFVEISELTFSRQSLGQKIITMGKIGVQKNQFERSFEALGGKNLFIPVRGNSDLFRLTEKGIARLMSQRLKFAASKNRKWDGFWRVIFFDIPEKDRLAREALRRKLKYLDFIPLQKSVFAYPFPCEKEIAYLAEFFKIGRYLDIILTKSLGRREREARDFFGI